MQEFVSHIYGMDNQEKPTENEVEEKVESSESEDFSISSVTKDALKDLPEVLSFIQRLQDCIVRQRALIHKLYQKLKKVNIFSDIVMLNITKYIFKLEHYLPFL